MVRRLLTLKRCKLPAFVHGASLSIEVLWSTLSLFTPLKRETVATLKSNGQ